MVHGVNEVARAGEQAERLTIAFLALAWFFIVLRTWTRSWIIASFGWDDATMILAGVILNRSARKETSNADATADGLYSLLRIAIVH